MRATVSPHSTEYCLREPVMLFRCWHRVQYADDCSLSVLSRALSLRRYVQPRLVTRLNIG